MIGVDRPEVLGWLGVLLGLILIYLIRHERLNKLSFGAIMFIRLAHEKSRRRLRIENWFQFLIRAGMLAVLVVLFARPHWLGRWVPSPVSKAGSCHLYVVDRSLSMLQNKGAESLFSSCAEWTRRSLEERAESECVGVIAFGKSTDVLLESGPLFRRGRTEALEKMTSVQPMVARTDLSSLDRQVTSILRNRPEKQWVIHFATGRGRTLFAGYEPGQLFRAEGKHIEFDFCPVGEEDAPNLSIITAAVDCLPFENPGFYECCLSATIQNFSQQIGQGDLTLTLGNARVGTKSFRIDPEESQKEEIVFKLPVDTSADLGEVFLGPKTNDVFLLDNHFPVQVQLPRRTRIGVFDGEAESAFSGRNILRHLLDPIGARQLFTIDDLRDFDDVFSDESYDIVFLNGVGTLPENKLEEFAQLLNSAVRGERLVFLTFSKVADLWKGKVNDLLMRYGFRFLSFKEGPELALPLGRIALNAGKGMAKVRNYFSLQVLDPAAVDETITFDNEQPFSIRKGGLTAFAVTFSAEASNVPFQSAVIPFFYNRIRHYRSATSGRNADPLRRVEDWDRLKIKPGVRRILNKDQQQLLLDYPLSQMDLRRLSEHLFLSDVVSEAESSEAKKLVREKRQLADFALALALIFMFADLLIGFRRRKR